MTGFTLDFENKFDGAIKDGTYEVVIYIMNEDVAGTGTEFTNVNMIIRNDIEQPHKNQHIFHRIWKSKETNKYNMMMFNTIGYAAQLENGKQYGSMDELLDDYVGKPIKVRVKNETSEYNGKTYENLNVKSWDKSEFPIVQHEYKEAPKKSTDVTTTDIPEESLPF